MTPEQRDQRIYHHLYVDSKSPLENAERITDLEDLIRQLWEFVSRADRLQFPELGSRIKELEVPL